VDAAHIVIYLFVAAFGLVTGSFLNVVIYRHNTKESFVRPGSRCPGCRTFLKAKDLVPLFSYLALKGRCRYCGLKLSPRYPLVEAAAAVLFLISFFHLGFTPLLFKYIVIFSILLAISGIDLEQQIIPNRFVLVLFCWVILWQLLYPELNALSAVLGFFLGGILFYLIAVLSKGGMGGGDVKLMAVLGFAIGMPMVFFVFLIAFLTGALVGILLIILKKKGRKSPLPFGPFLALAYFIAVFWGEQLWNWYFSFL